MCTNPTHIAVCSIIPPVIMEKIAENGTARQKELAYQAISVGGQLRGQREAIMRVGAFKGASPGTKRRTVFDAQHGQSLPGKLVRGEKDRKSSDISVNEAFTGSGKTYDFYKTVYNRNSIDDSGMRLDSTVHFRRNFNNAFWNGQQMVYGDGDGQIFNRFTKSIDVIGHELTHGVTQFTAGLEYQDQSGALNEHMSDVFGSLLKQYSKRQTAKGADWLIGEGLFASGIHGVALRSMKAPGTAYDDPLIGKDPQPDHMSKFVKTTSDNGGVHINSGIPNKAFCDLAISLGGNAWTKAGRIWYVTLTEKVKPLTQFQEFARMTFDAARSLFNADGTEQVVKTAWAGVGVKI